MSESCTLFCKDRLDDLDSFLKRVSLLNPTEVSHSDQSDWSKLKCTTSEGTVEFSRLVFVEQADPFAKLRWKTIVKAQAMAGVNPEGAKVVEAHLRKTEAILAVVVEPGFDQVSKLSELIGFLSMEYDGLIFNGSHFLDFLGNVIL